MARIEEIEGKNNIRVSKGYKPSIEETKSKLRESIVLRRQGSTDQVVNLKPIRIGSILDEFESVQLFGSILNIFEWAELLKKTQNSPWIHVLGLLFMKN